MTRLQGAPFREARLLWANPEACPLTEENRAWWGSLSSPSDFLGKVRKSRLDLSSVEAGDWSSLAGCVEEGTLACLQDLGERGKRLFLHRSINSTADLFYLAGNDGSLVVTDHFRNAVESLPGGTLSVTEDWLADLLLFPDMPGNRTILGPIRRVAHGETVQVDLLSGECRRVHQDRLEPRGETTLQEAPEKILEALDRSLALFSDRPGKAVLFSGGVDSTVLQWRLGNASEAVFAGCESPEFTFEREYANRSAAELAIHLRKSEIRESELPGLCLETLEETGQVFPVTVFQPVFNSRAFREPFRLFFSGDFADTLFGFSAARQAYFPETEDQARRVCLPATDPEGFAAQSYMTSDRILAERILGPEAVEAAIRRRLEYVLERFTFRSPERENRNRQAELAGFMVFFSGDWFNRYRQQAFSLGKTLHAPFSQRTVVEEALGIPMPHRVIRKGKLKHFLKEALHVRFPGCPVFEKKGGSGWPRTRLCTTGPFARFFQENPVPSFIPRSERKRLASPDWDSSTITLTCLFMAQWGKMFLEKKPGVVPGTRATVFNFLDRPFRTMM